MRTRATSNPAHQAATTHNQAMVKINHQVKTNQDNRDASYVVVISQTENTEIPNKVVHNKAMQTTRSFNKDKTTNYPSKVVNHAATAVVAPTTRVVHVQTAIDQDAAHAATTTRINSMRINQTVDNRNNNNNNNSVDHHSDRTDHVNQTLIKWASTQIHNNRNQADA